MNLIFSFRHLDSHHQFIRTLGEKQHFKNTPWIHPEKSAQDTVRTGKELSGEGDI